MPLGDVGRRGDRAQDVARCVAQNRGADQDDPAVAVVEAQLQHLVAHLLATQGALDGELVRRHLDAAAVEAEARARVRRAAQRGVGPGRHAQQLGRAPIGHQHARFAIVGEPHGRRDGLQHRLELDRALAQSLFRRVAVLLRGSQIRHVAEGDAEAVAQGNMQ